MKKVLIAAAVLFCIPAAFAFDRFALTAIGPRRETLGTSKPKRFPDTKARTVTSLAGSCPFPWRMAQMPPSRGRP